jgi:hypothetical protein
LLEGSSYSVELALGLTLRPLAFCLATHASQWEVSSLGHLLRLPAPLNDVPERERGDPSERFRYEPYSPRSLDGERHG